MKFSTQKIYRDLFTPGKITDLVSTIYSTPDRKSYKGFTPDEFAKVPKLYSAFNPREHSVLDLEDETIYKTVDGDEVFGSDIKALTMLMYNKPRTAYIDFGRIRQVHQTIYSGAVPYPLLGFKRFHNIKYDTWRNKFDTAAYIKDDTWDLHAGPNTLELAFKIDVLLGSTFASTEYDASIDTIKWKDKFGLLLLSTLNIPITAEEILYLRTKGMGNYSGTFATSYGAAFVDYREDINTDVVRLYNSATVPMKLLMCQRWAWYGNHRCSDMIMDFNNWDHEPAKHDVVENIFVGLKPQEGATNGLAALFNIGVKK